MGCVRTVIVSPAGPTCQPLSKFSKTPRGNRNWTRDTSKWSASVQPAALRVYTCAKFWYFPSVVVLYLYFLSKRSDSIGDRTAHPLLDMITAYHFSKCCFVLRIGNKLFYIINVIWPSVEQQIYGWSFSFNLEFKIYNWYYSLIWTSNLMVLFSIFF